MNFVKFVLSFKTQFECFCLPERSARELCEPQFSNLAEFLLPIVLAKGATPIVFRFTFIESGWRSLSLFLIVIS